MKNIQFIPLLFYLVVVSSCTGNENEDTALHRINFSKVTGKEVLLSELAKDIRYVTLEKRENRLIGRIDKAIFEKERIYLLDSKGSKSVHIYDCQGKPVNSISKRGRGPGEFLVPKDISFDRSAGELVIYCSSQRKLLHYSPDGDYIRETRIGLWFDRFEALNNGTFIAYTNKKYNSLPGHSGLNFDLIRFDGSGEILGTYLPNEVGKNYGQLTFSFGKHFFPCNDRYCFAETFGDTIYGIDNSELIPEILLDFGSNSIPGHKKRDVRALVSQLNMGRYACFVSAEFVADQAFITYIADGGTHYILYDTRTKSSVTIKSIENDIDDAVFKLPLGITENELVFVLYPDELLGDKDSGTISLDGEEFLLDISGNPILLFLQINHLNSYQNEKQLSVLDHIHPCAGKPLFSS